MPILGICFGHQLVATALGGDVKPSPQGWTVGPIAYTRAVDGRIQSILAWHRDQVTGRPATAVVVGSAPNDTNAMLRYEGGVLSYQCHPELTSAYVRALLKLHAGDLPETRVAAVLEACDGDLESSALGDEISAFFHSPS